MARPHHNWSPAFCAPSQTYTYDSLSQSEADRRRVQEPTSSNFHTAAADSSAPLSNSSPHASSHSLASCTPAHQGSPTDFSAGGHSSCKCAGCAVLSSSKQTPLQPDDSAIGCPAVNGGSKAYRAQEQRPFLGHGQLAPPSRVPTGSQTGPKCQSADSAVLRTDTRQMSINSLLSGSDPASPRFAEPPAASPAPCQHTASNGATTSNTAILSPAPPENTPRYCIHVRQQPVAARSCGFGEGDRRVIDPPPIVQLNIVDPEASAKEIDVRLRSQLTVVHCSIWDETGEQDTSTMPEDYRQQRRLMGTLVSSPFVGQDENGKMGCFFCFPDLSCRTPGSFRLKFSLVVLKLPGMRAGGSSPILATTMSSVFTVYSAKDFPGMQASTSLTKRLKKQGCLISVKKGNDKTGTTHSREESEDGEADDGASSGKSQKLAKRS